MQDHHVLTKKDKVYMAPNKSPCSHTNEAGH